MAGESTLDVGVFMSLWFPYVISVLMMVMLLMTKAKAEANLVSFSAWCLMTHSR